MSSRDTERATTLGTAMRERRAVPRVRPEQPLHGHVKMVVPASILDISSRGAQIEVAAGLQPQESCDLRIPFSEGEFAVHATVRRCRAAVLGVGANDERAMLYRAGLEFDELDPESLAWLSSNVLFQAGN
ncbi:MAG TPA: PilZ domain-containing protein [Thermoanaerobaculaceae bacterium]|nr:PilZ domain-containing protein [Thermoanaerobaculaceae bacterium]